MTQALFWLVKSTPIARPVLKLHFCFTRIAATTAETRGRGIEEVGEGPKEAHEKEAETGRQRGVMIEAVREAVRGAVRGVVIRVRGVRREEGGIGQRRNATAPGIGAVVCWRTC